MDVPPSAPPASAAIAACLPLLATILGPLMLFMGAGGTEGLTRLFIEGGWVMYGLVWAAIMAALGAAGCVFFSASRDFPPIFAILPGLVMWALGPLSSQVSLGVVGSVLPLVDPAEQAVILAAGSAEALSSRVLAGAVSASVLGTTALGLAIAAFSPSPKRPSRVSIAACVAASAVLATIATSGWAHLLVDRELLQLYAHLPPDAQIPPATRLASPSSMLDYAGLAAVAIAAALTIAARSTTAIVAAALALLLTGAATFLDRFGDGQIEELAHTLHAPWARFAEFLPAPMPRGSGRARIDAIAGENGLASPPQESPIPISDRTKDAMVRAIGSVMNVSKANTPELPKQARAEPQIAIAVDVRLDQRALETLLAALVAAGARSVSFVGEVAPRLRAKMVEVVKESPRLAPLAPPRVGSVEALLITALPPDARDEVQLQIEVGAKDPDLDMLSGKRGFVLIELKEGATPERLCRAIDTLSRLGLEPVLKPASDPRS
jgi:hypothetical protein